MLNTSQQKVEVIRSGFQSPAETFHPNTERKVFPSGMLASSNLQEHSTSFSTLGIPLITP